MSTQMAGHASLRKRISLSLCLFDGHYPRALPPRTSAGQGARMTLRRLIFLSAVLGALALLLPPRFALASGSPDGSFVNFESGQVRPLALSPDGTRLFAVNTPDDRLEIFDVGAAGLTHTGSVPVGLEPVAVAARSDDEVWVVNLLSDSVSIVDVSTRPARVTRTLLTCDEPRDIVFAGPGGN